MWACWAALCLCLYLGLFSPLHLTPCGFSLSSLSVCLFASVCVCPVFVSPLLSPSLCVLLSVCLCSSTSLSLCLLVPVFFCLSLPLSVFLSMCLMAQSLSPDSSLRCLQIGVLDMLGLWETATLLALNTQVAPHPQPLSQSWETLGQGARGALGRAEPSPWSCRSCLCVGPSVYKRPQEALCRGEGGGSCLCSAGPCCRSREVSQVRHQSGAPRRGMAPAGRDDFSGQPSQWGTSASLCLGWGHRWGEGGCKQRGCRALRLECVPLHCSKGQVVRA